MGRASKCPVPVSDLIQWDAPFLGEMPLPSGGLPLRAWGAKKKQYTGIQAKPMRMSDRGLNQQIEISIIAKMDKVIDLPLVSMYRTGCMRGLPIQFNLSAAVFEYWGTAAIPLELAYLENI